MADGVADIGNTGAEGLLPFCRPLFALSAAEMSVRELGHFAMHEWEALVAAASICRAPNWNHIAFGVVARVEDECRGVYFV